MPTRRTGWAVVQEQRRSQKPGAGRALAGRGSVATIHAAECCLTDLRLSCERRLMRRKELEFSDVYQTQRAHMQFFLTWSRSSASSAC